MPIRVELELDSGDFEAGIVRANTRLNDLQRAAGATIVGVEKMGESSKSFLSTLRDVTVILGQAGHAMENLHRISTGWVGEIVHLNAEVERMSALLKSMSTAADPVKEASDYIKNLREEAKNAPFALQAMHQAFIRMKAGGLDPAAGSLKSLVDAVAAFGGTDETLGRASLALQEMAGKGVVQMKELRNQLGMAVPQAMALLARSFGVTYQQLMEDVHTGTVDAKKAIESLSLEFDRVYGGAAQRQMETFTGQLARFRVIMMDLALKAGGEEDENGFFGTLKKQFKDFNDALNGGVGKVGAAKVGEMLKEIVLQLRRAVDGVIEFRHEIGLVGEALAYGFGAQIAVAGLTSLVGAAKGAATAIALLGIEWGAFMNALRAGSMLAAGAGLVGMLGTLGPLLPIIAVGGAALAYTFGLIGDSARSAYEEIKKFGAHSVEDVEKAKGVLDEIDRRIATFRAMKTAPTYAAGEIAKLEAERAEVVSVLAKGREDAMKEEANVAVRRIMDTVNETVRAQRAVYNDQQTWMGKLYQKEVDETIKHGRSIMDVRRKWAADMHMTAVSSYDALNAVLEEFKERQVAILASGNEKQKAIASGVIEKIEEMQAQNDKLKAQTEAEDYTYKNKKPMLDEKLLEKGRKALASLEAQAEGFKAGLNGLDPEVYELKSALESLGSMKYGDPIIAETKELIAKLLEAKENVDALHKAFRGEEQLNTDMTNTRVKMERELLELKSKGMSDVDKLLIAVQAGHYPGFGSGDSPMAQKIIDIRQRFAEAGEKAQTFGDILKKSLDPKNFAGLDMLAQKLGAVGDGFARAGAGIGGSSGSGSFVDKVIGVESGGDPNARAKTSSALGLGQFTESTWMQFITTMHADMLSLGEKAVLAARTDEGLMREAIQWLANTNANKMSKAGIDLTDANLYAAHFLGVGAAMSTLTKDDHVALSAIPELAKALKSNAFLRGMDVGDFKAFSERKMGSYLDNREERKYKESSVLGRPDNITDQQWAEFLKMKDLANKLGAGHSEENIAEKIKEIRLEIEKLSEVEESGSKRLGSIKKLIGEGKLDSSDLDANSQRYKELIEWAKKWDQEEAKVLETKKARTGATNAINELAKIRADQELAESMSWAGFGDPQSGLKNSEGFIRLEKSVTDHFERLKANYGADTEVYKKALENKNRALQAYLNQEAIKHVNGLALKTQELNRSLMTDDQARYDALQKAIELDQSYLARFKGSEEDRARLAEQTEAHIAALKANFAQSSPLGRQFKEMTQYADNFERAVGAAISSSVDNLTNMMTGVKVRWGDMLRSMAADFIKYALNSALGTLLKGGFQSAGGTQGIFGSLFSGAAGLVGAHHTGGIVGSEPSFARNVPMSVFATAPRFHTGGITGNEVPIIAKRGEGVFTEGQMKAIGAGLGDRGVKIHMPVTLHATGGSPQANQDLADRFSRQMEDMARGVMADEIRKQARPGGMLATKFGR